MKKMKWIFLIGLVARLLFFVFVYFKQFLYPDEWMFRSLGQQILNGQGIVPTVSGWGGFIQAGEPTAYFGLTGPAFFAVLLAIFGKNWLWLRLCTALLSWVLLFFSLRGYCKSRFNEKTAFIVLLIASIHPFLIPFSGFIIAEAVFMPLFATCLWFGERFRVSPTLSRAFALGVVYGVCHLAKMNLFGFQWIHLFYLLWVTKHRTIRNLTACFIGSILILGPWVIRNHQVLGHWILETKGGFNLVLMNLPRPGYSVLTQNFGSTPDMSAWPELEPIRNGWSGGTEGDRAELGFKIYAEMLKNHPIEILQNSFSRFLRTFPLWPSYWNIPVPLKALAAILSLFFYTCIILGVRHLLKKRQGGELILLFAYVILFHSITNASIRHRIGAEPFLLILAVLGATQLKWNKLRLN